jgi:dienelactone hydrolase
MTMRRITLLLILAASCVSAPPSAPPIWIDLHPGAHRAGFLTRNLGTTPDLLQVSIWYPSKGGGDALTWRDMWLLTLTERDPAERSASEKDSEVRKYVAEIAEDGIPTAAANALFAQTLFARRSAPPATGRYPLVLIAQGNGQSAVHQSILAEFLASHGYVVATIPSVTRLTGPMTSESDLAIKVRAEADNLQRALELAVTLPNVDGARIGLIGYSLGARAALLLAMRQPVAAFISLDGGIGTARGTSLYPQPVTPLPPILHIYETRDDRMKPDLTFLRSLPAASLRTEKLDDLQHVHFSSLGFTAALLPEIAAATKAASTTRRDVRFIAETVLAFLDENVKRTR